MEASVASRNPATNRCFEPVNVEMVLGKVFIVNGYHSENIVNNHDGNDMGVNPLVTVTDKASEVDGYVASMKQVTNNLNTSNKANIAKIEELQALVKYQEQRLLDNIKQHGISNPELINKAQEVKTTLVLLQDRLAKLKDMCNANKTAPIDAMIDKVAKLLRSQIACAMDAAYS